MVKLLSFRLQQCSNPFVTLSFEAFSETWLFRHLSNDGFLSPKFREYMTYEGHSLLENVWNLIEIFKKQKNNGENVFVFETIASELVALNCLYQAGNAGLRQSMREQTGWRFFISLKYAFSNTITFTVINKYGQGAVVQIATVF